MTKWVANCLMCGNNNEFTKDQMLLGYYVMHRFQYINPDLMCPTCKMDHIMWNVLPEWDDE